ncbi:MAG: TetR/AcrR family transcriptional regulator [bacterium]
MIARSAPSETSQGRGLDASRDRAILDAALDLVAEVGYDRVTMDAIAARARSSKATMYRRWDSKASLVVDALKLRHYADPVVPDTGCVRDDLVEGLGTMCAAMGSQELPLMTGLITAMHSDPELARLMRQQMVEGKTAAAQRWTARAIERGQLPADADLELFHQIAPAMVFLRMVLTGQPTDEAFVGRLVDTVLMPLIDGLAARPAPPEGCTGTGPTGEQRAADVSHVSREPGISG